MAPRAPALRHRAGNLEIMIRLIYKNTYTYKKKNQDKLSMQLIELKEKVQIYHVRNDIYDK